MTAFILPQRDENEKIETREKKTIFTKIMNIRDWTFSYFGECVMVKEIRKGFWADAYKVQIKKAGVSMAKVAVYDGDNIHWYSCKEGELLSDVLKREGYLLAMPCPDHLPGSLHFPVSPSVFFQSLLLHPSTGYCQIPEEELTLLLLPIWQTAHKHRQIPEDSH